MKVDYAFILAAGKGTRMGKIGQELPKVLWPVFDKSILELEVLYAKSLGVRKIFINTFYHTDKIKSFIQSSSFKNDVTLIEEEKAIDIGGAIHNMASYVNYKGHCIILNSDQFIMYTNEVWEKALKSLGSSDHVLFTYEVCSSQGYNQLLLDHSGHLQNIVLNNDIKTKKNIITYTGSAIIQFDKLKKHNGESKFFDTVANFNSSKIFCQEIKNSHYWDFGTAKRYCLSLFELLKMPQDPFFEFLIQNNAINLKLIDGNSYKSKNKNCINLTGEDIDFADNKVILSFKNDYILGNEIETKLQIIFDQIVDNV